MPPHCSASSRQTKDDINTVTLEQSILRNLVARLISFDNCAFVGLYLRHTVRIAKAPRADTSLLVRVAQHNKED